MNILEICQQVTLRAKQPKINDLFLDDDQSREYLGYASEASNYIFSTNNWRELVKDYSFTTVLELGEEKRNYSLPIDYDSILVYYIYDKTRQITLENSDDDQSLLNETLRNYNRDWIKWRIIGDEIVFDVPIESDRELLYTYKSKNFIKNIDNTGTEPVITYSQLFKTNNDEFLINDELLILGILWQRSVSLGFPDVQIRESKFKEKLSSLMSDNSGLRKTNIFNRNGYRPISGMNYAPYPFSGGC